MIGDYDYGVCGDCNAIGVQHTSGKFGCKLLTLFGSVCDDGLNAVVVGV